MIDDSPDEIGHHSSLFHSSSDLSRSIQQQQQQLHHQHQSSNSYRRDGGSSSSASDSDIISNSLSSSSSSSSSMLTSSSGLRLVHGALVINSVKVANKGLYLCNVSNDGGSELLEVIFLLTLTNESHFHFQPSRYNISLNPLHLTSCITFFLFSSIHNNIFCNT